MAGGDMGNNAFDPATQYAELRQRVASIENTVLSFGTKLESLTNALNERSKTPWAIILSGASTSLGGIALVGGLIAWGLSTQNSAIVTSLNEFKQTYEANRLVSRNENLDKFAQAREIMETIRSNMVPRSELDRVFSSYDARNADQQRQIDDLKASQGSVYGARDALLDMRERLDRLEQSRRVMSSP